MVKHGISIVDIIKTNIAQHLYKKLAKLRTARCDIPLNFDTTKFGSKFVDPPPSPPPPWPIDFDFWLLNICVLSRSDIR